jgi:hypothetical protein
LYAGYPYDYVLHPKMAPLAPRGPEGTYGFCMEPSTDCGFRFLQLDWLADFYEIDRCLAAVLFSFGDG